MQERLLPQAVLPRVAGLDYAGVCRPALGVGGDYYDFIALSDTELGIVVGDVSGKGIAAALLMATLRAHVHGEMLHGVTDPAEVIVALNRLVYESSSSNRYATLFYGRYDSTRHELEYVNAGHNPPLLFKTCGDRCDVLRLDSGGPVVGFIPDCAYLQGRVTFEPGDVVVAFTDGMSEAMNADGDEWGEERLARLAMAHRASPARALVDHVMRGADEFVAGSAQHDDMTLVAVRVV